MTPEDERYIWTGRLPEEQAFDDAESARLTRWRHQQIEARGWLEYLDPAPRKQVGKEERPTVEIREQKKKQ